MQIVVGTAGHIDHGKTALVKALTGTDTDGLAEEKARGMTIDLGFAYLDQSITIIDVPGHEKFIKNMVAGVSTIDIALLVVAADDGIMPQTREHLQILKLLGIKKGIIALTKTDLITDPEWIDLIELELHDLVSDTFLKNAPLIRTSIQKNIGLDILKEEIIHQSKNLNKNTDRGFFYMPIDRVFSKKGFGTIVTGTVLSGKLKMGDELDIVPGKKSARVRGLQTHGSIASSVKMGDRAAINLSGTGLAHLIRGQVISSKNWVKETNKIIARVTMISDTKWELKNRQRVHLHIGTTEVISRVVINNSIKSNQSANVLFLLEKPLATLMNQNFIIRSFSPMETIGGCVVLDTDPTFKRKELSGWVDKLCLESSKRFNQFVNINWKNPKSSGTWARDFNTNDIEIKSWITKENLVNNQGIVFSSQSFDLSVKLVQNTLRAFHQKYPYKKSLAKERIIDDTKLSINWLTFIFSSIKNKLVYVDGGYALKSHSVELSINDERLSDKLEEELKKAEYNLPNVNTLLSDDNKKKLELLHVLKNNNKVYEIAQDKWIHASVWNKLTNELSDFFSTNDSLKVADFKNITNTSRKNAIPMLEFLDKMNITNRSGDFRIKGKSCG